jgi:hypothetical protein
VLIWLRCKQRGPARSLHFHQAIVPRCKWQGLAILSHFHGVITAEIQIAGLGPSISLKPPSPSPHSLLQVVMRGRGEDKGLCCLYKH